MYLMSEVLLIWLIWLKAASYNTCLNNKCANWDCNTPIDNTSPCKGCKDGYTGERCSESCPPKCLNCSQNFFTDRLCYACKDGYYNGQKNDITKYPIQNDCSLKCRPGCKSCVAYENCTECKIGYNMGSEKKCYRCHKKCAKCSSAAYCVKCKNTYFSESGFCKKCKPNCKVCNSSLNCTLCNYAYFVEGTDCKQCQEGCEICIGPQTCNRCQKGYYLINSQCLKCQNGCKHCKLNKHSRYVCKDCQEGYYHRNGKCSKCGKRCLICKSPSNCRKCNVNFKIHNGFCYKCPASCISCSSDNNCTSCHARHFNENGQCHPCPIFCTSCSSMDICKICKDGTYGGNCSLNCPQLCDNKICDQLSGICANISCKYGNLNDGKECISCSELCTVCKSQITCSACEKGYRGDTCTEKCLNCKANTPCEKSNGHCFGECRDGLGGHDCDKKCAPKCSTCFRDNPSQCITCAINTYGDTCSEQCSEHCMHGSCHNSDGSCMHDCKAGFWGKRCEHNCPLHCSNDTCDRYNGSCTQEDHPTGKSEDKSSISSSVMIGTAVPVVVVILVVVAFTIYKRRKGKQIVDCKWLKRKSCGSNRTENNKPFNDDNEANIEMEIKSHSNEMKPFLGSKMPTSDDKTKIDEECLPNKNAESSTADVHATQNEDDSEIPLLTVHGMDVGETTGSNGKDKAVENTTKEMMDNATDMIENKDDSEIPLLTDYGMDVGETTGSNGKDNALENTTKEMMDNATDMIEKKEDYDVSFSTRHLMDVWEGARSEEKDKKLEEIKEEMIINDTDINEKTVHSEERTKDAASVVEMNIGNDLDKHFNRKTRSLLNPDIRTKDSVDNLITMPKRVHTFKRPRRRHDSI